MFLPNTDIVVSRLGFGTGSLHRVFSSRKRKNLLRSALISGISHYDTAPYYGNGLAEIDLGKAFKKDRQRITITSKIGLYPPIGYSQSIYNLWVSKFVGKLNSSLSLPKVDFSLELAQSSLYGSLKRLKTDYIDFLLIHEPNISLINQDELLHWLELEKNRGAICEWGLAGHSSMIKPWLNDHHELAKVIQTNDSIEEQEANFIFLSKRDLQFTYGYFSHSRKRNNITNTKDILLKALLRNNKGSIIFSSTSFKHINEIASLANY